ncbi:MAG: hypothetical protein K8W52_03245 [Deltaproteobacteria bacterium]|nr:hypothetical protein [Deltaproteobacteria bacterium]
MHRITDLLPDALGAAVMVHRDGAWTSVATRGYVEVYWALGLLDLGQRASDAPDAGDLEAVVERGDVHVVIGNGSCAVVARLPPGSNIGLALGCLREVMRSIAS